MIISKQGFEVDDSPVNFEESNKKFFDSLYLKILKDVSFSELTKEFHLGRPVTQLFNLMEDYQKDKTFNFFENSKSLAIGTVYHFFIELHYKPKTGLQNPILYIDLDSYCIRDGVFFNVEKTTFSIYLTDFKK